MIFYDCETPKVTDALPIPPAVCGSFAIDNSDLWVVPHYNLYPYVCDILTSNHAIAGHHIAFDMSVIMYQWPQLIPWIFAAYDQDRVTCTAIRQKLLDIADPTCEKKNSGVFYRKRGRLVRAKYSLEHCMMRHFDRKVEGKGGVQLEYGPLMDVPFELWSSEAQIYPADDIRHTRDLYEFQERDSHLLADQYRQARKSFWLTLMSGYGLATNKQRVETLETKKANEKAALFDQMLSDGLLRYKGPKCDPYRDVVKNEERVRQLVEHYWDGEPPRTDPTHKSEAYKRKYPNGRIKCDADTLKQIGHLSPELERYKRYKNATDFLSRDIPALKRGCNGNSIHTRFDSLKATGRTSSSDPNVQNPRRSGGVRECYEPREWIWNQHKAYQGNLGQPTYT